MFALNIQKSTVIRSILTAVIVFNAMMPNAVGALVFSNQGDARSVSTDPGKLGGRESVIKPRTALQVVSTPTETATPIPTSEPVVTLTPINENIPTQTSIAIPSFSELSIEFSANPNQAKAGEQVTFTLKIVNNGKVEITGLRFSNVLPTGFNYLPGENKDFFFDTKTRELSWMSANETAILPGESLSLEYSIQVDGITAETQIVDSAILNADLWQEPIEIETILTVTGTEDTLTILDEKGGKAIGLNGKITLNLPKDSLEASAVVVIRDLTQELPAKTDAEPWLVFELGISVPQTQIAQAQATEILGDNDQALALEPIEANQGAGGTHGFVGWNG